MSEMRILDSSLGKLLWTLCSITKLSVCHSGRALLLKRMRGACYERQTDSCSSLWEPPDPEMASHKKPRTHRVCPTHGSVSTGFVYLCLDKVILPILPQLLLFWFHSCLLSFQMAVNLYNISVIKVELTSLAIDKCEPWRLETKDELVTIDWTKV